MTTEMPPLLLLLILLLVENTSPTHIRYVKPINNSSCPGQPCLTLGQFTLQSTTYFTTGSTFVFLAGNHLSLDTAYFTNISDITLKGEEVYTDVNITLLSPKKGFILCEEVTNLTIEGINFLVISKSIGVATFLKIIRSIDILIKCTTFGRTEDSNFVRPIYMSHSTLTAVGCLFIGNMGYHGAALYVTESNITLNGNVFLGNRARYNGGAVYAYESIVSIMGF